jgi:predicted transcriptional regulator
MTRLQMLDALRIKDYEFAEFVKDLYLNPNTVNFHLRMLEQAKLVTKIGAGYTLTDFGRTSFESLIRRAEERLEERGEDIVDMG